MLEAIGLQGQRLQMINVSSAMAGEFAFAVAEITAEVTRLGPTPLRANGADPSPALGEGGSSLLDDEDTDRK
jgi:F420-non-reducing hydrogenase iron-sulfur subunit